MRSSVLREGERAKEAKSEFLVLVENAIRQPDLAKSVQRYQLAADEAKVRLNLAVRKNDYQHKKDGWLQQEDQTGGCRDETRGQQ